MPRRYAHRMEELEIWKPAVDVEDIEVSNLGRARSLDRMSSVYGRTRNGRLQGAFQQLRPGKMLSPCIGRHGYLEIALMRNGKRTKYRLHRLVAAAFVAGYFEKASIDHRDGNKLNNRADNLEWVTLSENTRRQWESGLVNLRGELHPSSKLTNLQANAVAVLYQNNFPPSQIAEWFGVSSALVYKIVHGKKPISGPSSRHPKKAPPTSAAIATAPPISPART